MTYIYDARADRQHLGGKAAALAELGRAGFNVPAWFVVGPDAFRDSLKRADRAALLSASDAAAIRALVAGARPKKAVQDAVAAAVATIAPHGEPLAVRSSAADEDGAEHSFAGQLDSFLFVAGEDVPDRIAAVWRSGFSARILAYRREHGLPLVPRPPSVLVQQMVDADAAGVAFSADPVSGRRNIAVVSAVYGLGTALVSGACDADTFHVDRAGAIVQRSVATKALAHRAAPTTGEGVASRPVAAEIATRPALSDDQVRRVAALAAAAERHFGRPQDIEWALRGDALYLLQSRAITALAGTPDPDAVRLLWDNSNIVESYSGVTTPLTFTFARHAYEGVYREFCRILGVPAATIANQAAMFRNMLGLIRGRVYYNLLNWYRLIALLPGFHVNRAFMEQMMGVKQALPEDLAGQIAPPPTARQRRADRLRLWRSGVGLLRAHFALPGRIRRFYRRLNTLLAAPRTALEQQRPDELAAAYRALEAGLLTRWDAPILNDFFAMVFYGTLRRLTARWCGDADGTLQNDLVSGAGGIISAEPARRVREMASAVADDAALVAALCEEPLETLRPRIAGHAGFAPLYDGYLAKFGDRCLEELKLESLTLHDDPLALLRSVGHFARRLGQAEGPVLVSVEAELRRKAEARVSAALRRRPLRHLVFRWVLKHARARVRDRENLRFERTRLFGRIRRIFVELGKRLGALDRLAAPRDVFYLELDELTGFVEGTATTGDLRGMVAVRKAEFERFAREAPPPERFETRGPVHASPLIPVTSTGAAASGGAAPLNGPALRGLGCCPGVVRGPVRIIRDPRGAELRAGEILVAERTDPGWITLFPAAAGLLIERGSLLSHSAIVAREMGIPTIVSLSGVTGWVQDGEIVELDGSTGIARRISAEGLQAAT